MIIVSKSSSQKTLATGAEMVKSRVVSSIIIQLNMKIRATVLVPHVREKMNKSVSIKIVH